MSLNLNFMSKIYEIITSDKNKNDVSTAPRFFKLEFMNIGESLFTIFASLASVIVSDVASSTNKSVLNIERP